MSRSPSIPSGSTWLSLLASSSLGVALAVSTPAVVRADEDAKLGRGPMRLVVQTFSETTRRPVRSVQRSVTADELRRGVRVDLVDLSGNTGDERVLAWVEPGDANLEYDGRVATPSRRSLVGTAKSASGPVEILLGRKTLRGGSPPRARCHRRALRATQSSPPLAR